MATGPSRAPAMTDVARLAGVSHQTVSRVLNDHPNVKQQTRLRVLAAMQELGYRPNRAARALASGRSDQIGIVAQPSTLFGPASLLYAVEAAAVQEGYGVSVASVAALDRASIEEAVNRHLDQQVGGIVVIVPVVSAAEAIREVPADKPLVTIGGDRNEAITSVGHRPGPAGRSRPPRPLLDAGHRTVWHVSGPADVFDSIDRIEGWRATLERAGAEVPPVITGDWSAAGGYEAGKMLARIRGCHRHLRRQRPDRPGDPAGAARARPARSRRREPRRLRRPPRVGLLHPAADDRSPGVRGGGPPGPADARHPDGGPARGAPRAGARRCSSPAESVAPPRDRRDDGDLGVSAVR